MDPLSIKGIGPGLHWSTDGHIAVNGGSSISILRPRLHACEESTPLEFEKSTIELTGPDEWAWSITKNVFEDYIHLEEIEGYPIKADRSTYCKWSPKGISSSRGCILAVITSHKEVMLYECSNQMRAIHGSQWIKSSIMSQKFLNLVGLPYKSEISDPRILKFLSTTTLNWSASLPFDRRQCFLATGNKLGQIHFWKFGNGISIEHISHIDVKADEWIKFLDFSGWIMENNALKCLMALASSDGSSDVFQVLYENSIITSTKLHRVLPSDGYAITSLSFSAESTLAVIKGHTLTIWNAYTESHVLHLPTAMSTVAAMWSSQRLIVSVELNDILIVEKCEAGWTFSDTSSTISRAVRNIALKAMLRDYPNGSVRSLRDSESNRPLVRIHGIDLAPNNGQLMAIASFPYFDLKMNYFIPSEEMMEFFIVGLYDNAVGNALEAFDRARMRVQDPLVWTSWSPRGLFFELWFHMRMMPQKALTELFKNIKYTLSSDSNINSWRLLYFMSHVLQDQQTKSSIRRQILNMTCRELVGSQDSDDFPTAKTFIGDLDNQREKCAICQADIFFQNEEVGVCTNNHPWARCTRSLSSIMRPNLFSCVECGAKINSDFMIVEHCNLCGGQLRLLQFLS